MNMDNIFVIFKITNLLNDKIFLGYFSGLSEKHIRINNKELLADIELYGKNHFKKEIIKYFSNKSDMQNEYKLIVGKNFKNLKNTYNALKISKTIQVIDEFGNILNVKRDDERYVNGELKYINFNKIIVRDSSNNNLRINKNDQRYIKGELQHVNSGKIIVKDSVGNKLSVDKNDERFLNGELVGIQKNRINVKDLHGNILNVYKNNQRYINGELKHINSGKIVVNDLSTNKNIQISVDEYYKDKNKYVFGSTNKVIVKDSSGNILRVNKYDERYINGELKHINSGKFLALDSSNNILRIDKTDERYVKGELNGLAKGKTNVTDGSHILNVKVDEIPDGCHCLKPSKESILKITKGRLKNLNAKKTHDLKENYNIDVEIFDKRYLLKNYCEHQNVFIDEKEFKKITKIYKNLNGELNHSLNLCEKCKKEILDKYVSSREEENIFRGFLKNKIEENTSKYSYLFYDYFLEKYFPKLYKSILLYTDNMKIDNLYEKIFIYAYELKPFECKVEKCHNKTFFSKNTKSYNIYCEKHLSYNFSSNKEHELMNWVKENYKNKIFSNYKKFGMELDIYIPEHRLAIEFNGLYWHCDKFKNKDYHYKKWQMCKNNGIKLINIWEDDWDDLDKRKIVKSLINNKLMLNLNKIYARNCLVKEIDTKHEKEFLIKNHLQGWTKSNLKLGLFNGDELVSVMSFGKRNLGKISKFELIRFCSKLNTNVIGGASKLFTHFINNYNYNNEITSYANLDISNGNLYHKLGFKENKKTRNYWWAKNKKYNRINFMKHKLVKEGFDKNKTEDQIMKERGYYKIWGTGNLLFIYDNQ